MPSLIDPPPCSEMESVTEVLHGVSVSDPFRWLEDQNAPRTREWLTAQSRSARSYLDSIPGRERVRERIRELVDVETYDSFLKVSKRYLFRKRFRGQEQACISVREGKNGRDEILIDPAERGTGPYTAVKPLCVSADGRLLLYEVKQGGERTGTFELFDIAARKPLPDRLPRGYLRGFAFSPDAQSFFYVHEAIDSQIPQRKAAYRHMLGIDFAKDTPVFDAGQDERIRLHIISGTRHIGFLINRFLDKTLTDFYVASFDSTDSPKLVVKDADYLFVPRILNNGRIMALTNRDASNFRIVEVLENQLGRTEFRDIVPPSDPAIQDWSVAGDRIFISYYRNLQNETIVFDFSGKRIGEVPAGDSETLRIMATSVESDELIFERESFTKPIQICCYSPSQSALAAWAERSIPFDSSRFQCVQVRFRSKDGTQIPMFLVARQDVLEGGTHPTIVTSYGGYGIPMTPQFSVFVAFLMERGCLFALPNIRGGSEFGTKWHKAAKRRKRQVAFDDFLSAAEWLIETGRTKPDRLAIFGGSNSGLLVAAAITQRPELFRAAVCMVPMTDMLRYHRFDYAHIWKEEYGTAEDREDFAALLAYSPYHNVRDGVEYPATMIVSGDADQNCNPLHARKMTARLQMANASDRPILLDYSPYRGHSPVLPLSMRVGALTDRMAFLCDQLGLEM
jgi:prolyl oligopeptidase